MTSVNRRREEIESQIGCGKTITGTFMPYPDETPTLYTTKCGAYVGDDGPGYCDDCNKLIEELWELEE